MSGAGSSGRRSHCVPGMKRGVAVGAVLAALAGLASCSHSSAAPHSATSTAAEVPRHAPTPTVVASGLHFPVNITFDQHGGLWFTSNVRRPEPDERGLVHTARRTPRQVVKGLAPAGLAWVGNNLYVASTTAPGTGGSQFSTGFNGSRFASQRVRLDGLRWGNTSSARSRPGPTDTSTLVSAPRATDGPPGIVLSFAPDGGTPVVKATGLQSPFGLAFYGRLLLVTDTGRDDLGPFRPPEKLNEFNPAGPVVNFGFPGCYGQGGPAVRACARRWRSSARMRHPPESPSRATSPLSPRTAPRS